MKYLLLIMLLLLPSCAEFQTKLEMMEQMNCKPPHNTLCAGWKVGDWYYTSFIFGWQWLVRVA